jgi:hypothetical protein
VLELKKIINSSKVNDDNIMQCYDILMQFLKSADTTNKISEDQIFSNLLQINALFAASLELSIIDDGLLKCEKICDDCKNFFNPNKNINIKGARHNSNIRAFIHLMIFLSKKQLNKTCEFIKTLSEVYDNSIQNESTLPVNGRIDERDFRDNFVKNLFIESARLNVDSNSFHGIFDKYKDYIKERLDEIINEIGTNQENKYYRNFISEN